MQILGSILPGLRDVRAPLVAGYIWLTFVWVVASPDLDARPDDRAFGSIYDLGQEVGPVGVAIAASVAAYLIGSISQAVTELALRSDRVVALNPFDRARPIERVDRAQSRALEAIEAPARELTDDQTTRFRAESLNELDARADLARFEATRELGMPATLLVGDRPELFAEIDRERTEGDLRLAVVFPLSALTVALITMQSLSWLLAVPLLLMILLDGLSKVSDSRQLIAGAIALGRVQSPSQAEFETWIERFITETLPIRANRIASGLEILRGRWGTPRSGLDVTERLRSLVSDGRLVAPATNENMGGDPDPGTEKMLEVEYSDGQTRSTAVVREGETVRLPPSD